MRTDNLDLKIAYKHLYSPSSKTVNVVNIPPLSYLMIDGEGNPNTAPDYVSAVEALYGLAYGIRAVRKAAGDTFTVMPLEGLWAFKGEQVENFNVTDADKDRFVWTLMILQPESVTAELVATARENLRVGKKSTAFTDKVRFESYHEGEAVQIMHLGPYSAEGPTVARLHAHIENNGWSLRSRHHEIYLSDPRKVAPEKMKTVIRQPFAR